MSQIKKAMDEVYGANYFSAAKKRDTLAKATTRQRTQKPFVQWAVVVFSCLLLFLLMQPKASLELPSTTHSSADHALRNGFVELANRKVQFQAILADEVITPEEKMAYLQTSDWALQLAFEKGVSTTYALDDVALTDEQRTMYATLLFYMREYIYSAQVHVNVVQAFEQTTTFRQFDVLVDVLDEYVLLDYVSALNEEMPQTLWLLRVERPTRTLVGATIMIVVLLTLFNIMKTRYKRLLVGQLIVLAVLLTVALRPVDHQAAVDETTLVQSSELALAQLHVEYTSLTLLDSAQFDNVRLAFVQLHGNTTYPYAVLHFERQNNDYFFRESQLFDGTNYLSTTTFIRNDGQVGVLVALPDGHRAQQVELLMYTNPVETFTFDVQEGQSTLRMYYVPHVTNSFGVQLYDRNGHVIKGD